MNTGPTGTASYLVDFTLPPANVITPSSSWNFQFWFRDALGGGSLINLSDALAATF